MTRGLRSRAAVWLSVVVIPFLVIGWFTIGLVEDRLESRVETDLANARRLEAARISDALADYERAAWRLATGPHVIDFVAGVTRSRARVGPNSETIGGYDDFDVIDPAADEPLAQLVDRMMTKAALGGSQVLDLVVLGPDGSAYGATDGASWTPYQPSILVDVFVDGQPRFGNAFLAADGSHRLGHVMPVFAPPTSAESDAVGEGGRSVVGESDDIGESDAVGEVVGVLVIESELGPIVDLAIEHEGFGETSEAHLAQLTPDGDAQFITLLRFERDAAFTKIVPKERGLPINQSLASPGGAVVQSPDYRAVPSVLAIETIEETGWGLVIKIDAAEAFTPVGEVRDAILIASGITAALVVLISTVIMNPLARRIQRLSAAARRMAEGDYESRIDDRWGDEIGQLAASIDRLAADLERDHRLRNEAEEKLRARANIDHLTGISNRHEAHVRLHRLADGADHPWSVLFIDLDGFKPINDEHGHAVGDEVLRAFAGRLSQSVPTDATVARWGGDEFLVVLPGTDGEAAADIAGRLREQLSSPFATSAPDPLTVTWCAGVASAPAGEAEVDDILRRADSEMLACKSASRRAPRSWNTTERAVSDALADGRIEVHYQPICRLGVEGPSVVGAEALVRKRRRDGELLTPAQFLPAVVNGDVGAELDRFVLRAALREVGARLRDGTLPAEFEISVNLGSASLVSSATADAVCDALDETGVPPRSLVLEISESAPMLDLDQLARLTARGVKLAIDDLGVDRANLDRLVETGATYAKLDRRWIRGGSIQGSAEQRLGVAGHLVRAVRSLGVIPVAEGVETDLDAAYLSTIDVDIAQGYLYGRPGSDLSVVTRPETANTVPSDVLPVGGRRWLD